jgi:opacity protein-like surface antigen
MANIASAHCSKENMYLGGGIGLNSKNTFDGTGYQFFGGYCLDFDFNSSKTKTAFEVGYMSTGEFEEEEAGGKKKKDQQNITNSLDGIWFSALSEYRLENKLNIMGRVGLDMGDDDGVFFGGGLGYNVSKTSQVRAEYVIKNEVDSVQFNFISEF